MTVLMFVWCRAYGCRSVSVGLIFPLFLLTGALVPLYLVLMDPSKDWLAAPMSDFDSIGNRWELVYNLMGSCPVRLELPWIWRSDHGKVIPFLCSSGARWFGFAGWNCVRVSASSPFWPWGTTSFGTVSGSGTYVRTPSRRCSICLIEWSVQSSEDMFWSEVEMDVFTGRPCELPWFVVTNPHFGGWGDRQQRTEVIWQCGRRQGCARQWRAGGGLLLPLKGWVGGYEMSRTRHVMHLLWRGHQFGHLSLCLAWLTWMTSDFFPINDHVMFSDDGVACLEEFLVLDRLVVSCLESIPFPSS